MRRSFFAGCVAQESGHLCMTRGTTQEAMSRRSRQPVRHAGDRSTMHVNATGCQFAVNHRIEYLGGLLPPTIHHYVDRHFNECSSCREKLDSARAGLSALVQLTAPEVSRQRCDLVMQWFVSRDRPLDETNN